MTAILVIATILALVLIVRSIQKSKRRRFLKVLRLPTGERVDVVGESHYQRAIERIAGKRTDESKRVAAVAILLREPGNPYDKNAVAVFIRGHQVGYLAREDASLFQPLLLDLEARGEAAVCDALIVGGWDRGKRGQGYFGVQLDLQRPTTKRGATGLIVQAQPVPFDLQAVAAKLRAASGPATRRTILARALEGISENDRKALLLEASRIEVEAVMAKVRGLKTVAAKRRNLEAALLALKQDEVDDELQAQQISWLQRALVELEAA